MQKNVLLVMNQYEPEIHLGVANFAKNNNWHLKARGDGKIPQGWSGDGIIARAFKNSALTDYLRTTQTPAVCVKSGDWIRPEMIPVVREDGQSAGLIAAKYFIDLGFRNFGWYGSKSSQIGIARRMGYTAALKQEKFSLSMDIGETGTPDWHETKAIILKALNDAPKPLGLFVGADSWGIDVMDICIEAGISIPEEIAVLSVGNSKVFCEPLAIPLSSVDNNQERIGYQAAQVLDSLMQGQKPGEELLNVESSHVVTRQSTDTIAVPHLGLAKAVRFIAHNYQKPLSMEDVATAGGMSKPSLFKAFKRYLHKSPGEELLGKRIEHAQRLLVESDSPIEYVAEKSGFGAVWNLQETFRKKCQISPSRYRKLHKKYE